MEAWDHKKYLQLSVKNNSGDKALINQKEGGPSNGLILLSGENFTNIDVLYRTCVAQAVLQAVL